MPSVSETIATTREDRRARERPHGVAQIPPQVVQPGERSGIAMQFFRAINAAEHPTCRTMGVVVRHPAAWVLIREQREM